MAVVMTILTPMSSTSVKCVSRFSMSLAEPFRRIPLFPGRQPGCEFGKLLLDSLKHTEDVVKILGFLQRGLLERR